MSIECPLFSIVVPIYNEERFIQEALDSILSQTDTDWEAILVDDGSTDSTPEILGEYEKRDSRFRIFHKNNGGQSSAINLGVQEAKGEWLCWLSGDDYFHPQKLEMNRRWIQDYPEIHFFFTGFWIILENGKKIEYSLDWLKLENPDYHLIQLLHSNWVMGISVCIKRNTWLKTGEFNGRFRYAHDLDMWIRLMLNTHHRYLPERTCTMRYHSGQETARFPLESMFDAAKILIHLVNEHSFKELFPDLDLYDKYLARDILSRTIDFVAGKSDTYIYQLGVHPLLHLRILEWIWDPVIDLTLREELRNLIIDRSSDFISFHNESSFGLLWQATRAALKINQPRFAYFPCEAEKIGKLNYYIQRVEHSEVAQPLRRYLEQTDGISFDEAPIDIEKTGQLILLLPSEVSLDDPLSPEFKKIRRIWQYLAQAGFFVLLVGRSKYTMGLVDGLLYLGAENVYEQDQLLTNLGDLDTVVVLSHPERLKQVEAERQVYFEISQKKHLGSELFATLIHEIQSTPRKKICHIMTARRLHLLHTIYTFLIPISVRIRIRFGSRLQLLVTFLKKIRRPKKQ